MDSPQEFENFEMVKNCHGFGAATTAKRRPIAAGAGVWLNRVIIRDKPARRGYDAPVIWGGSPCGS